MWNKIWPKGSTTINLGDHPWNEEQRSPLAEALSRALQCLVSAFGKNRLHLNLGSANALVLITAEPILDWQQIQAKTPLGVVDLAFN